MAKPDPALLWPERFLFIGCGNMAGAMLSRWLDLGLSADRVTVVRPSGQAVAGNVRVVTRIDEPVARGTLVLLGFKPQQLGGVSDGMAQLIGPGTTLLSILAGVPLGSLRDAFPQAGGIIRCMPNLPVRIGKGVSILEAGLFANKQEKALVTRLCATLGLVEWLDNERLFDAATALAGCGPAFLYRFIDALTAAGIDLGLDPASAARMALAMVEGAALSAAASEVTPRAMADAVASKGGMTRKGLDVLDAPDGLAALIAETLRAARDQGATLAALSDEVS
jgi:pyrroline-5-carboxylate reductase